MSCRSAVTAPLPVQLRGARRAPQRRSAAPARSACPCASAAAPPPPAPRRAFLASAAAAALLVVSPRPALADGNPLEGLLEARRRTNAKFLLGPVRLGRFYLAEAAAATDPEEARKNVSLAAFDCVSIGAANLQTFSDLGRDVCTYRIVARSVTTGPAARHAPDSAIGAETTAAVNAVVSGFGALDAELSSGGTGSAGAYAAVGAALDRFETAVLAAIGVSRAALAEVYAEDKPPA